MIDDGENFSKETIYSEEQEQKCSHKEIGVFVINNHHQVLLQKRSANKKSYPNKWALLTGHVKEKESFKDAVLREIKEEIGIEINETELFPFAKRKFIANEENYELTYFFYVRCNLQKEDFIIQEEELSEVKWCYIDEVISMVKGHDQAIILNENRIKLLEYLKHL